MGATATLDTNCSRFQGLLAPHCSGARRRLVPALSARPAWLSLPRTLSNLMSSQSKGGAGRVGPSALDLFRSREFREPAS